MAGTMLTTIVPTHGRARSEASDLFTLLVFREKISKGKIPFSVMV